MDNVTLSGYLPTVERDIITITNAYAETGLRLNTNKCEIIMEDFSKLDEIDTFKDFMVILKNSLPIPKLLYLLRTSDCGDNPLLSEFDNTLRSGLTSILNVDLSENQ